MNFIVGTKSQYAKCTFIVSAGTADQAMAKVVACQFTEPYDEPHYAHVADDMDILDLDPMREYLDKDSTNVHRDVFFAKYTPGY